MSIDLGASSSFSGTRPNSVASERDRLFLAVVPDSDTAARIYQRAGVIRRARKIEGALIRPEHLHATLFFLGERGALPEQIITRVVHAAAAVKMPPFEVSFDRTMSFSEGSYNHPFVLVGDPGVERLKKFRQMLGVSIMRNGLRHLVRANFMPHVTLLYDKKNVDEQPIEPISWIVHEFVLIRSLYRRTTHIHEARWPLRS
ncbi:2'-5' RNA ligase family protein [Bradyrhizobium sp.]